MFCTKCGQHIEDTAAFCNHCGAPTSRPAPQPAAAPAPANGSESVPAYEAKPAPATAAPTPVYSAPSHEVASTGRHAAPAGERPHKAGKSRKGLAIAGSLVALVAVGVGLGYFLSNGPTPIDENTFPDPVLRSYASEHFDTDQDGSLSKDEAAAAETVQLIGSDVSNLVGLEKLSGLAHLDVSECPALESADIAPLEGLVTFNAQGSGVKQVNIGSKPKLTALDIAQTAVSAIDVSGCSELKYFRASGTPLEKVDLSNCKNLASFEADESVPVEGIEAAGLREQWLLTGYEKTGYCETFEGFGPNGIQPPKSESASFEYDELNRLVEKTVVRNYTYEGSAPSSYTTTTNYQYTGESLKPSTLSTQDSQTTMTYDDLGRLTSRSTYQAGGRNYEYEGESRFPSLLYTSGRQVSYGYESGLLTSAVSETASEGISSSSSFSYNDEGKLVQIDVSQPFYDIEGTISFTYDENGNCIQEDLKGLYAASPGDLSFQFAYEDGRVVKATSSYMSWTDEASCEYDAAGNLVRRSIVRTDKSMEDSAAETTYTYRRVITSGNAPDVFCPLVFGNPLGNVFVDSASSDFSELLRQQDPVVRSAMITNIPATPLEG